MMLGGGLGLYVAVHGGDESTHGVISFEINVDVTSAVPVRFHWVVVADEFLKVQGVLFVGILDSKVVKDKSEVDGASLMDIQAKSILGREVPSSGKDFFELMVGKFSSLFEAIHGLMDFNVDKTVGSNFGSQVVVTDDVRGEIRIGDPHEFKPV